MCLLIYVKGKPGKVKRQKNRSKRGERSDTYLTRFFNLSLKAIVLAESSGFLHSLSNLYALWQTVDMNE
jgi:hypothetical protein